MCPVCVLSVAWRTCICRRISVRLSHLTHLVGYPRDYKDWLFYNPYTQKSFVSDSAVFRESVFPFRKTGLSGVGPPLSSPTPTDSKWSGAVSTDFAPLPAARGLPVAVAAPSLPTPLPPLPPLPPPVPPAPAPSLVVTVPSTVPNDVPPLPALPPTAPSPQHVDLPMRDACVRPRTPPAVKRLTAGFEHHPINDAPLPAKRASRGRLPGALTEANLGVADGGVAISVVDAIECAFYRVDPRGRDLASGRCIVAGRGASRDRGAPRERYVGVSSAAAGKEGDRVALGL